MAQVNKANGISKTYQFSLISQHNVATFIDKDILITIIYMLPVRQPWTISLRTNSPLGRTLTHFKISVQRPCKDECGSGLIQYSIISTFAILLHRAYKDECISAPIHLKFDH
ncbi:uncharacterized protein LOC120355549 [Nilaparvata lugens]|uniref:uncharacterized protein LOC120350848 n=1 Tax=Nilaparvata lugens TaxID=108931 RepID=UPI00193EB841|nr:uncharacterized protein LOC120350848 [Nilaparvata lugens]XP_039300031.1 uncharacterized protein LOC120355549 [Nilaparvata lugens]